MSETSEEEVQEPEAETPEAEGPEGEAAEGEDVTRSVPVADPDEVAATATEFIGGLGEAMGIELAVATEITERRVQIDVTGEDLGVLIGRRGQTLDALQELTRTAVQRRLKARVRLLIDVEGYRARRRSSLVEYAQEMAQRAIERGTEIELEPMNAFERKIVHDAVGEIEGASSFSEGEEPERRVVVRGA